MIDNLGIWLCGTYSIVLLGMMVWFVFEMINDEMAIGQCALLLFVYTFGLMALWHINSLNAPR